MKVTDEMLKQAIKKNAGIVKGIIDSLKKEYGIEVSRNAIYNRKSRDKEIADAFTEAEENVADIAENRLITAINEGELKAVIFYLKTKGKKRGYTERQEFTGADGEPIKIADPFDMLSKEELMQVVGLTETRQD